MRLDPYTLIYFGTLAGLVIGLIPLILGIVKKKTKYGILGLVCSTIGGALLGIFLIVPVLIFFIWLIMKKPGVEATETVENTDVS